MTPAVPAKLFAFAVGVVLYFSGDFRGGVPAGTVTGFCTRSGALVPSSGLKAA
jgi:hypothetical protein